MYLAGCVLKLLLLSHVYQPDIYRLPDKGLYINSYMSTNSSTHKYRAT